MQATKLVLTTIANETAQEFKNGATCVWVHFFKQEPREGFTFLRPVSKYLLVPGQLPEVSDLLIPEESDAFEVTGIYPN
jgi:hypothetical protein